ncbi:hypothetical protein LTR78_000436 [Recurvomyces mirabilis]|uniref:Uncharacterized protein n=1 Tax=Recurvomyces mirabilis TaxID=574656 RepID=A0AAE1C6J6_9PEZI|nr:hypothetical protein LTR78_000436 [Recurvomyces mirabilis]KAK5162091.1 hypothetical protein LTS14_000437 [Recurvomyces mirabilis]
MNNDTSDATMSQGYTPQTPTTARNIKDVAALGPDSVYRPHHVTHVCFPAPSLLSAHHKDAETVFDIMNAHGRNEERESDFYSMEITSKPGLRGIPDLSNKTTLTQLLADMAKATSAVGETLIQVHAYTPAGHEIQKHSGAIIDDSRFLRIQRTTCHRDLQGILALRRRRYKGRYIDLQQLPEGQEWIRDIHDLIGMRNDRAYRHIRVRMGRDHAARERFADTIPLHFKAPRYPPFGEHFPTLIRTISSTLLSEDEAPVKHLFGKSCLLDWCNATGPENVGCPTCRAKIFTDESTIAYLNYGVRGPDLKTYEPDPRYTNYENWERSCDDVDKNLASNNGATIDIEPEILTEILQHFLFNARLEPEVSTPLQLQPVHRAELPIFVSEFERTYQYFSGPDYTHVEELGFWAPEKFGTTAALVQLMNRRFVSEFARRFGTVANTAAYKVTACEMDREAKGDELETELAMEIREQGRRPPHGRFPSRGRSATVDQGESWQVGGKGEDAVWTL